MPGMDGRQTLEKVREIRPDVPVMVCSGFGDKDMETRFEGQQIACFMSKPYTAKHLARKVKECLTTAATDL